MQVRSRTCPCPARSLLLLVLALIPCLTLMPPARAQSGLTVADASFETVTVGPSGTFSSYQYDPAGSPWAFSGSAGIAASGSGFTSANPPAPDGAQVAFLQGAGSITQAISGFQAGAGCQFTFSVAQRGQGNTAVQDFQVYLDNTLIGTYTPSSASYATFTTNAVIPGAGTHTLKFVGLCSAGGDNTALIDNIQLQTLSGPVGLDGSFEGLSAGPAGNFSSYLINPTGSPWTFSANSGIAANTSGFTYANPPAPDGVQVAFLHGPSTISQAIGGFQAGTGYQVAFSAAQRGSSNTAVQDFQVYLDTTLLGTFTPGGAAFAGLTTTAVVPGAGTHTLRFVGLNSAGGDNTALLDNIHLQTVAFGPPANLAATTVTATAGTDRSGGTQVALTWTASPGAAKYNLYRGTSSGGETLLKAGITGTSYIDPATGNGTVYYYQASAMGADGTESAHSGEAIPPVTTGSWLHCDKDGTLADYNNYNGNGYPMFGPLTGSASNSGIDDLIPLAKQRIKQIGYDDILGYDVGPDPLDPSCWLYGNAAAPQDESQIDAIADAYSYTTPNPNSDGRWESDDSIRECTSNVNVDGKLSAYFKWVSAPASVPGQALAPVPDHMDVRVNTWLYAYSVCGLQNYSPTIFPNGTAFAQASDDEFGESTSAICAPLNSDTATVVQAGGNHLMRVSPSGGIATVTLTGHSIAKTDGGGLLQGVFEESASARADILASAQPDSREATLVPMGHEVTYHKGKGTKKNADGTDYIDPVTGNTVPTREANTPNNESLQVDIGLPIIQFLNGQDTGGSDLYSVSYKGLVDGGSSYPQDSENTGDTYNFTADLHNGSDSGTMPLPDSFAVRSSNPFATTWDIPALKVQYKEPCISYPMANIPQLAMNDANGGDNVKFTYTFQKDGAQANYNLNVILHMPNDHWHLDKTEENDTPPFEDVECDPSPQQAQLPLKMTYSTIQNSMALGAQVASGSLTAIATLVAEYPLAAAAIAVMGYAVDKAAPEPGTAMMGDSQNDWSIAMGQGLISGIDPSAYNAMTPAQQSEVYAHSKWSMVQRVPIETFHWEAENYAGSGYTGQTPAIVTQALDPIYFHKYTYTKTPPAPPIIP